MKQRKLERRGMMAKCFACVLAVGLGWLLSPAATRGQSLVSPAWIQHAWANESGFSVRPSAIGVSQGNVYVTGNAQYYRSGVTFGGIHRDADGSYAFLASYDLAGNQQWVRSGAFTPESSIFLDNLEGFLLAADEGGIYTSEGYEYAFDAGMFTSGGVSINRYGLDGTHEWTTAIHPPVASPGDQPGFALGLGLDRNGNVYVAGIYRDTLILAPDTLEVFPLDEARYIGDVFLAGYAPDGNLRWSRRIGGPRHDVIAEWIDPRGTFTVDSEGNTYLGGFFSRGATFGEGQPGEITLTRDAYGLASYDAQGLLRWVRTERDLGISDNAGPWRLAVDANGNLFVDWFVLSTGSVNRATVGDTTFTDPGFGGEFLTKVAPDGTLLWARQIESDGNDIVTNLAVDVSGHVYVAGLFDGNYLRLEATELRKQDLQADREDGFVARYDPDGRLLWAGHAAGTGVERIIDLTVSPEGDLYVAGEFNEVLRLGATTLEERTAGGLEMFVAKYDAATITAVDDVKLPMAPVANASAYPNPFRDRATIRYEIRDGGHVRLAVYDVLGREVRTLVDGVQHAGTYKAVFESAGLPSGLYLYRLESSGRTLSGTMLLLK